jgi:hypothetical protein
MADASGDVSSDEDLSTSNAVNDHGEKSTFENYL